MVPGETLTLTVERLAFGGDAVGRTADGRVVFVDRGAPGDRILVCVDEVRPRFLRGHRRELLAPGPNHAAPPCPVADRCGGCPWQEVARATQLASKQELVERALRALGGAAIVAPIAPATASFAYRTRARFAVAQEAIGFHGRRSLEVIEAPRCAVLHPALDAALARARALLRPHLAVGGSLGGLVGRGDAVQLAVSGLGAAGWSAAATLLGDADGTGGIIGVIGDGRRVGAEMIDTAEAGEPPFFAAATGFAQASAAGNRRLRELVAAAARAQGKRVLELHAGDGNFTRDLVPIAASVRAVESEVEAAARLRRNVPAATVEPRSAQAAARSLVDGGASFDLVLLDPPRRGAKEVMPLLPRLASEVVYVSCDPMTFARDAEALVAAGLTLEEVTPVDLMPHTDHVELVACFRRRGTSLGGAASAPAEGSGS